MSTKTEKKRCWKHSVMSGVYGSNLMRYNNTGYRLPARTIKKIRKEVTQWLYNSQGLAQFTTLAGSYTKQLKKQLRGF